MRGRSLGSYQKITRILFIFDFMSDVVAHSTSGTNEKTEEEPSTRKRKKLETDVTELTKIKSLHDS